jgi:hypothetical protein
MATVFGRCPSSGAALPPSGLSRKDASQAKPAAAIAVRLSPNERTLLVAMSIGCSTEYDDWCGANGVGMCYTFKGLADMCPDLHPGAIRRTVRALKRKGFAGYANGLMNEDGEVAGAGYGITRAGRERGEVEATPAEIERLEALLPCW